MSEKEYTKITVDHPLAFARAFAGASTSKKEGEDGGGLGDDTQKVVKFVHVSGEGAIMPSVGRASSMFGRVKGVAEEELLALPSSGKPEYSGLRIYNCRPGGIDPGRQFTAQREKGFKDKLGDWVMFPVLRAVMPGMYIPADKLAEALVGLAMGDGEPIKEDVGVEASGRCLRNTALRWLAAMK